jgi:hypothetical protein
MFVWRCGKRTRVNDDAFFETSCVIHRRYTPKQDAYGPSDSSKQIPLAITSLPARLVRVLISPLLSSPYLLQLFVHAPFFESSHLSAQVVVARPPQPPLPLEHALSFGLCEALNVSSQLVAADVSRLLAHSVDSCDSLYLSAQLVVECAPQLLAQAGSLDLVGFLQLSEQLGFGGTAEHSALALFSPTTMRWLSQPPEVVLCRNRHHRSWVCWWPSLAGP